MTYLDIPHLSDAQIQQVVTRANKELQLLREASGDLIFAPFKGNDKNGGRRRRIDYALARQILKAACL
jgi:hypothetical protein